MERCVIYCDVDGVVGDWEGRLLEIYGLKNDSEIREYLKEGGKIEDKFDNLRERVAELGPDFWSGIKPFFWAQELVSRIEKYGDFSFLTSSGNHNKRPIYAAGGAYGKLIWLSENFNGKSVSICRDKHLHAHSRAILIDDNKKKVENFIECGGEGFLFPHAYKIEDGEVRLGDVYRELEKKILGM